MCVYTDVCVCVCMYTCVCIYIYIYIYIERERDYNHIIYIYIYICIFVYSTGLMTVVLSARPFGLQARSIYYYDYRKDKWREIKQNLAISMKINDPIHP